MENSLNIKRHLSYKTDYFESNLLQNYPTIIKNIKINIQVF